MEATALCTRLLMDMLWLLVVQVQDNYSAQNDAGSVILEIPVLPPMEGEVVTLRCRNETASSNLRADFYKDGVLISSSDTGNLTIHNVSKSDEALYKCNMLGAGGSAERRLAVRVMSLLLLLAVQIQNCHCAQKNTFPLIDPNRLQFFDYDSFSVSCEELDLPSEWRVMRKQEKEPSYTVKQETSSGFITIKPAYSSDGGEYWCENEEGERSNSVNITVTARSVILESPAVPVMEGDDVILYCRHKMTESNLRADFYKDGRPVGTGYEGHFPIHSVSKSDEGLYKCSISGGEESAESWLAVRENPSNDDSHHLSIVLSVVFTVLFVAVLLLVVGRLQYRKHREEAAVPDPDTVTYAVVTTRQKKRDPGGSSSGSAGQTSSAEATPNAKDNNAIYSTLQSR